MTFLGLGAPHTPLTWPDQQLLVLALSLESILNLASEARIQHLILQHGKKNNRGLVSFHV